MDPKRGKQEIQLKFIINKLNTVKLLIVVATILFIVTLLGLAWLASMKQEAMMGETFGFMALLAFTSGLSMIILPCTLPLLFPY